MTFDVVFNIMCIGGIIIDFLALGAKINSYSRADRDETGSIGVIIDIIRFILTCLYLFLFIKVRILN